MSPVIRVRIGTRTFAATKVVVSTREEWLLAGSRSAQFRAVPNPTSPGLLDVWDMTLAHRKLYGLELRESGNTLVVHRHPGGELEPTLGRRVS